MQEEQRVMQSSDLATRFRKRQDVTEPDEACSYEGVYFDTWWNREQAAKKREFKVEDAVEIATKPLTVLAIYAPTIKNPVWSRIDYSREGVEELAQSLSFIFQVGRKFQPPKILSGLLGGDTFNGNRPLLVLLHLLLEPTTDTIPLDFHYPILWQAGGRPTDELETATLRIVDDMLQRIENSGAGNMDEAIGEILSWKLQLNRKDADLIGETFLDSENLTSGSVLPVPGTASGNDRAPMTIVEPTVPPDVGPSGQVEVTPEDVSAASVEDTQSEMGRHVKVSEENQRRSRDPTPRLFQNLAPKQKNGNQQTQMYESTSDGRLGLCPQTCLFPVGQAVGLSAIHGLIPPCLVLVRFLFR